MPCAGISVHLHGQVSRPETTQGEQELLKREGESKRDKAGRAGKTRRKQGYNAETLDKIQCLEFPECLEFTLPPLDESG